MEFKDPAPQTHPIIEIDGEKKIQAYGNAWPLMDDIALELNLSRMDFRPEEGGLGALRHLVNAHNLIWPEYARTYHEWTHLRFKTFLEGHKVISLAGGAGTAKAQPLHCKIKTPSGWITIEEAREGDEVCAPDGSVQQITKVHDVGVKDVYRVLFADGSETLAAGDHLWSVKNNRQAEQKKPWQVKTTLQVLSSMYRGEALNQRIPITRPVAGTDYKLALPPYLLGYMLGNGSLSWKSIRISVPDEETVERLKTLWPISLQNKGEKKNNCYVITPKACYSILENLGLRGAGNSEKFVPHKYLHNTPENRLELLRGLMDADGTVSKGRCSYSTSSLQLATNIQELCESLGIICTFAKSKAGYRNKNGEYTRCKDSFRLHLREPKGLKLFHLSRKKEKQKHNEQYRVRKFKKIELVGEMPCRCISVSGESQLYLTERYIVTHNSADAARYALLWWWSLPEHRTVIVCSTTINALTKRIWSYVTSCCYKARGNLPGIVSNSPPPKILHARHDTKHGIHGAALKEGQSDRTLADLIGIHPDDGLLVIVDEATDVTPAIYDAITNWDSGGVKFQMIVIGNSKSRLDPHGRLSEPLLGWNSVNPDEDEKWETKNGVCLFHDCYRSPYVLHPERKQLSFLISSKKIAMEQKRLGTNDPKFWRFVRGFWPPEDITKTVLSLSMCEKHGVRDEARWEGRWQITIAGLDPAFTSTGDECILRFATLGPDERGILVLDYGGEENIISMRLDSKSKEPVSYQIVRQAKRECLARGVDPYHFGADTWGIGTGAGDIFEVEWSDQIHRIISIGAPSNRYVDSEMTDQAFELYDRINTELWFSMKTFVEAGQIKGLDEKTIEEFCTREYSWKGRKIRLETKEEYKERMGYGDGPTGSPDRGDAAAIVLEVAQRLGFAPGKREIDMDERGDWEKQWEANRFAEEDSEEQWNVDDILDSAMFGEDEGVL